MRRETGDCDSSIRSPATAWIIAAKLVAFVMRRRDMTGIGTSADASQEVESTATAPASPPKPCHSEYGPLPAGQLRALFAVIQRFHCHAQNQPFNQLARTQVPATKRGT